MKKFISESLDEFIKNQNNTINEGFLDNVIQGAKNMYKAIKTKIGGFIQKVGEFFVGGDDKGVVYGTISPLNTAILNKDNDIPSAVSYIASSNDISVDSELSGLTADKAISKRGSVNENLDYSYERYKKLFEDSEDARTDFLKMDSNIRNINASELVDEIESRIYNADKGVFHPKWKRTSFGNNNLDKEGTTDIMPPLLIWGAPGIGKTEIVNEVLKNFSGKKRIIDVQTSKMTPDDWSLPIIANDEIQKSFIMATIAKEASEQYDINYEDFKKDPNNPKYEGFKKHIDSVTSPEEYTKILDLPKSWLPVYTITGDIEEDSRRDAISNGPDNEGGIIFLDEITRASKGVQATLLKLVGERIIGNSRLGSKWVIIAAGNREKDVEGGIYWDAALSNRFYHVNFVPEYKEWRKWAKDNVYKSIITFLDIKHQQYFYTLDEDTGKENLYASPRSWHRASQSIMSHMQFYKEKYGKKPSIKQVAEWVAGTVGTDIGAEFLDFLRITVKYKAKDIINILTNGKKAPIPKGPNGLNTLEAMTIINLVVTYTKGKTLTKEEWENYVDWLIKLDHAPTATAGFDEMVDEHEYMHKGVGDEVDEYDEDSGLVIKVRHETYKEGYWKWKRHYEKELKQMEEKVDRDDLIEAPDL